MNTPARLLIIDDEERIRNLLLDFFEDYAEFAPQTVGSAEEGLDELAREPAALWIVDMRLPGMSGLEFARKLARSRRAQPVIIVTAYGSQEALSDLAAAGVSECFTKPFGMDALRRAVRRSLQRAAMREQVQPRRKAA